MEDNKNGKQSKDDQKNKSQPLLPDNIFDQSVNPFDQVHISTPETVWRFNLNKKNCGVNKKNCGDKDSDGKSNGDHTNKNK